mmetsp:Transcript_34643/g.104591  ORF Transcript_34643/g.104591 Transcript_34643/m.104591 type:complete len:226 (+) Transcript_34643:1714-2391(+)
MHVAHPTPSCSQSWSGPGLKKSSVQLGPPQKRSWAARARRRHAATCAKYAMEKKSQNTPSRKVWRPSCADTSGSNTRQAFPNWSSDNHCAPEGTASGTGASAKCANSPTQPTSAKRSSHKPGVLNWLRNTSLTKTNSSPRFGSTLPNRHLPDMERTAYATAFVAWARDAPAPSLHAVPSAANRWSVEPDSGGTHMGSRAKAPSVMAQLTTADALRNLLVRYAGQE